MPPPIWQLQVTLVTFIILIQIVVCSNVNSVENENNKTPMSDKSMDMENLLQFFGASTKNKSFEIMNGVFLSFPARVDGGDTIMKFKFGMPERRTGETGRGMGSKNKGNLITRILPMFIMPFLLQSAILPMVLSTIKMMLFNTMLVGKLALLLIAINAFKSSNAFKSRNDELIAGEHYGYHGVGMEEYGSFIHS